MPPTDDEKAPALDDNTGGVFLCINRGGRRDPFILPAFRVEVKDRFVTSAATAGGRRCPMAVIS